MQEDPRYRIWTRSVDWFRLYDRRQTDTHIQTFFLKHIFRLWEWCRRKNHEKSKSNFLTIAILPSLLMSLESKNCDCSEKSNYIAVKFQQPSHNIKAEKNYFSILSTQPSYMEISLICFGIQNFNIQRSGPGLKPRPLGPLPRTLPMWHPNRKGGGSQVGRQISRIRDQCVTTVPPHSVWT